MQILKYFTLLLCLITGLSAYAGKFTGKTSAAKGDGMSAAALKGTCVQGRPGLKSGDFSTSALYQSYVRSCRAATPPKPTAPTAKATPRSSTSPSGPSKSAPRTPTTFSRSNTPAASTSGATTLSSPTHTLAVTRGALPAGTIMATRATQNEIVRGGRFSREPISSTLNTRVGGTATIRQASMTAVKTSVLPSTGSTKIAGINKDVIVNPVSIQTANANRGAMAMPKAVTIQPISCQEEYNKNNGKLSGQCCKEMFQVFEQTYASSLSGQTQARLEDDQIVAAHLTINVMGREGAHTLLSTIINDHFVVINQSDLHIAKKNTPGSNHLPGASMPVASPITIERVNNNVALLTRAIQVHDSFIDTKNNKNAKMKLIDAFKVQNFQTANMYLDQIREQARANYDKVKSLIIPTKDKGSETSKNSSKAATAKNEFNNNIAALGQRCPDYTFTITLDPNILPLANSPQPMGGGSHRPNARDISRK